MMPRIEPFERHTDTYEAWFDQHPHAYTSELEAVRSLLPPGEGAEIGVGSGRFAGPLGIRRGVEPSSRMRELARRRGIQAIAGVAEALAFPDRSLDFLVMVTTICFVDDPLRSLAEAFRVLRPGGRLLVGFVDRESSLGQRYQTMKAGHPFYSVATFFSAPEVEALMRDAGFEALEFRQTLFNDPDALTGPEPVLDGYGQGAFVVVSGRRPREHS